MRRLPADQMAVYQDEVEIHLNPRIGRDWMLCGRQTEVVTPGQNHRRHMAGTLDAKTGKLVWVWGEHRDSALFIDLLRALAEAYPQAEKIHLILNNCAAHDSQATTKALQTEELEHIARHFLPPLPGVARPGLRTVLRLSATLALLAARATPTGPDSPFHAMQSGCAFCLPLPPVFARRPPPRWPVCLAWMPNDG
jgi:hypothetical protein